MIYGAGGEDILRGGTGKDRIKGGAGDDFLIGGSGNDMLNGGDGDDRLIGGDGDDRLAGGNGDDILSGGSGKNVLSGGDGADTFYFSTNAGETRILDFDIGVDRLNLDGVFGLGFVETANGVTVALDNGAEINFVGLTAEEITDLFGFA